MNFKESHPFQYEYFTVNKLKPLCKNNYEQQVYDQLHSHLHNDLGIDYMEALVIYEFPLNEVEESLIWNVIKY